MRPKTAFYLGGAVLVAIVIWFAAPFFTVDQNKVGVVSRFGKFERVATPGLNFMIPIVNSFDLYPTDIQQLTSFDDQPEPKRLINTYTEDNQEVDISWSVFYRLPIDKIPFIFESNRAYKARLNSLVVDRLKAAFGHVNVQQVAERRGKIRDDILATLKDNAEPYGLLITDFQLPNLEYGESFRAAIGQAAVQKANIERMEYQRQQAEKTALTAKIDAEGKANAVKAQAEGDAAAIRMNADANAHRVEVAGLAEAKAIEAQTKALAQAPQLIELRKAERWNGQLPSTMLGSSPVPLISVDSLQQHK